MRKMQRIRGRGKKDVKAHVTAIALIELWPKGLLVLEDIIPCGYRRSREDLKTTNIRWKAYTSSRHRDWMIRKTRTKLGRK